MNTETKQPKSVLQQVKEYLADNATITVAEFSEASKLPKNQISTALWKLQKLDIVKKTDKGVYERLKLTPVNKTKKKRKVVRSNAPAKRIEQFRADLEHANQEILRWRKEARNSEALFVQLKMTDQKLEDALAVIRYLEAKLFIAIQHDARTNGNT